MCPFPQEDLDTRLKRLISAHKCMLFMKVGQTILTCLHIYLARKYADSLNLQGNPEEPKCGFSKQTVGIFKDLEADYGTFDILNDDEVGFPIPLLDRQ